MFTDYVYNGQAFGEAGAVLRECRFEPSLLRPFIDSAGRKVCTINTGRKVTDNKTGKPVSVMKTYPVAELRRRGIDSPVFNATSLRKEEWIRLDEQVLLAARSRLRAWTDLANANSYGGFDGMSKMLLEHETQSDPGTAYVDFDGLTEGSNDAPIYQLQGLPLPITHSDFYFSSRKLAISRNGGSPLDSTMAEAAGRRVAEQVEKTLIGVETGPTYGGSSTHVGGYGRTSSVYGYTNFTPRLTKTNMTVPLGSNPEATVADVLAMRNSLFANKFYGPFMVYHSTDWDTFLDNDYARLGGSNANMTLRDRLRKIEGIQDVRRLDFLTSTFTMILVQMTSNVARAVNGMGLQTVQWESVGGMRLNFKVMCIWVPQLRADFYGNCGILHGTTA